MKIKSFEFNLFGVNTYVVWNESTYEAAVIDPGMENVREEAIFTDFISDNNLKITHLINTHLHIDHTFGNDFIEQHYNVGLEACDDDDFLGKARAQQAQMFHLRISPPSPLQISVHLRESDKISIGDEYLKVIEVPGHSPGSIVLYSPVDHFLISGDVLFDGSIGRTDLPGGSQRQLIDGIRNKLLILPDDTVVYPGHGPSTTIGYERLHNPYLFG